MKKYILCIFFVSLFSLASPFAYSQNVAINNTATAPVPSAVLDLNSNTGGGFLLPYMTTATRNAIALPLAGANSLLIYNSDDNCFEGYFSRVGAAVPCNCWQALYCPCSTSPSTPVVSGTASLCASTSSTYTVAAAPNGATTYTWTLSGGGTFSNSTTTITGPAVTQSITWGSPGSTTTYTISVVGSNSCASNATPGTLAVTVNAALTAPTVTGSSTLSINTTGNTFSVPSVAGTTYNWTVPSQIGTITAGAGTDAITVTASGTVETTYSITVQEVGPCNTVSTNYGVSLNTCPTAINPPANTTGCTGNEVDGVVYTYTVSAATGATGGTSYTWLVQAGSGGTKNKWTNGTQTTTGGTTTSPNLTWGNQAGTYTVEVQAVTAGCTTLTSAALSVNVISATQNFTTAGATSVTVPCGVTTCTVTMYGGQGGNAYSSGILDPVGNGGGAELQTTVTVIAGTTLSLYVGGGGVTAGSNTNGGAGGTNGTSGTIYGSGGTADQYTISASAQGGGGGGGASSEIWVGASRLLVAGGGGGEGLSYDCSNSTLYYEYGGSGGSSGSNGASTNANTYAGQGASGSAGVAGTAYDCGSGTGKAGQAGQANGIGGYGGYGVKGSTPRYWGGGAGGGGFYGGGGASDGSGGGGSSGYASNGTSFIPAAPTYTTGANFSGSDTPNDGSISITW